jgi:hypothetical protein
MPNVNYGPAVTALQTNTGDMLRLPGTKLSTSLNNNLLITGNQGAIPAGTLAWSSDLGLVVFNGTTWVGVGGSTSGAPSFGSMVTSASPGSTVNNYSPTGFSNLTSTLRLTAASGGTTLTGLSSTGFVQGQSLLIRNMSTTDVLTFERGKPVFLKRCLQRAN